MKFILFIAIGFVVFVIAESVNIVMTRIQVNDNEEENH